jgi:hypothetical protein
MTFFDRLLGRTPQPIDQPGGTQGGTPPVGGGPPSGGASPAGGAGAGSDPAIERYRYLLRTAPPDDIERAHAEAFAQLTPDQRALVLRELGAAVPPSERATSDDPAALARMATRAELRQPGTVERVFTGPSLGSVFLGTFAGAFVGTAIAQSLFADGGQADSGEQTADANHGGDVESGDGGGDTGGDFGGGDFGGGDLGGGDFGDFGDFGGGDFG